MRRQQLARLHLSFILLKHWHLENTPLISAKYDPASLTAQGDGHSLILVEKPELALAIAVIHQHCVEGEQISGDLLVLKWLECRHTERWCQIALWT